MGDNKTKIVSEFVQATAVTFIARIVNFLLGITISVIIARLLGPEGKGIYTLSTFIPSFVVIFANLGIGSATVYYVAKGGHRHQVILGNNILLGLCIAIIAIFCGLLMALFTHELVFHGVPQICLLLAVLIIPGNLFYDYLRYFLLGIRSFRKFNSTDIIRSILVLLFVIISVWVLKAGVKGAILAVALSWFLMDVILFFLTMEEAGGMSFRLDFGYIRDAAAYGFQTYLGSILTFLNYRVDILLVNIFLNASAVGYYSIAVTIAEKLWLLSQAAGLVLFPMAAAETVEQRRKELTPLVTRTVLYLTTAGALTIYLFANLIIRYLYSDTFLPSVLPMQVLLLGIIALSASRVLAYDIAGRGQPMLNTYVSAGTILTNVSLNLIWIPSYGIVGAAMASSVSYTFSLLAHLFVYRRVSHNSLAEVLSPQSTDLLPYRFIGVSASQWAKDKMQAFLSV